jgi:hypothetical protein
VGLARGKILGHRVDHVLFPDGGGQAHKLEGKIKN